MVQKVFCSQTDHSEDFVLLFILNTVVQNGMAFNDLSIQELPMKETIDKKYLRSWKKLPKIFETVFYLFFRVLLQKVENKGLSQINQSTAYKA